MGRDGEVSGARGRTKQGSLGGGDRPQKERSGETEALGRGLGTTLTPCVRALRVVEILCVDLGGLVAAPVYVASTNLAQALQKAPRPGRSDVL